MPGIRRTGAVGAIRTETDDHENEELMIRIYLAPSEIDGEVILMKQIKIVTMCSLLELDAMMFGHYSDEIKKALATEQ